MKPKNTMCLWFDKDAHEAARFYAATFPNSEVTAVHKAPGDFPSGKQGDGFLDRQRFGGPSFGQRRVGHAVRDVRTVTAIEHAQRLAGLTQGDGDTLVQRRCSGGVDLTEVPVHLSQCPGPTFGCGASCGRPCHPDDPSHWLSAR